MDHLRDFHLDHCGDNIPSGPIPSVEHLLPDSLLIFCQELQNIQFIVNVFDFAQKLYLERDVAKHVLLWLPLCIDCLLKVVEQMSFFVTLLFVQLLYNDIAI